MYLMPKRAGEGKVERERIWVLLFCKVGPKESKVSNTSLPDNPKKVGDGFLQTCVWFLILVSTSSVHLEQFYETSLHP